MLPSIRTAGPVSGHNNNKVIVHKLLLHLQSSLAIDSKNTCSLQSAVCILHSVCILPLVRSLQSAVRSLRFTLTGSLIIYQVYEISGNSNGGPF